MSINEQTVRSIFADLEHGLGSGFFRHVADDVDWTVMGTHPLAGILKCVRRGIANSGQRRAADEMEHWA
jgi:ketosteroid isomerase-like protein